jgi:hypothetical protein
MGIYGVHILKMRVKSKDDLGYGARVYLGWSFWFMTTAQSEKGG